MEAHQRGLQQREHMCVQAGSCRSFTVTPYLYPTNPRVVWVLVLWPNFCGAILKLMFLGRLVAQLSYMYWRSVTPYITVQPIVIVTVLGNACHSVRVAWHMASFPSHVHCSSWAAPHDMCLLVQLETTLRHSSSQHLCLGITLMLNLTGYCSHTTVIHNRAHTGP